MATGHGRPEQQLRRLADHRTVEEPALPRHRIPRLEWHTLSPRGNVGIEGEDGPGRWRDDARERAGGRRRGAVGRRGLGAPLEPLAPDRLHVTGEGDLV